MSSASPAHGTLIEFPLRLVSDLDEVCLAEDVCIRRIDDASRTRILGISKVVLDENGRLKSYVSRSLVDPLGALMGPDLDLYDQLFSSNYVATLPTHEDASHLNFALKLLGPSCSSLFIGCEQPGTKHFLSPPCYYGDTPLAIGASEAKALSRLLALKRNSKDPKLELMAEMFLYAFSVAPRKASRFVELSIVLEMLLLPTSSTELSYRFALRMAKFLAKHWAADPIESFNIAQQIYKTRSRLVHSGRDESLPEIVPKIEEAVRQLLTTYLTNPELFEDSVLDHLCIAG
jgi:hypothetical protein